jgi:hypothetical protein
MRPAGVLAGVLGAGSAGVFQWATRNPGSSKTQLRSHDSPSDNACWAGNSACKTMNENCSVDCERHLSGALRTPHIYDRFYTSILSHIHIYELI